MFPCVTKTRDKGQFLSVGTEKDAGLGGLGSCNLHHGEEGAYTHGYWALSWLRLGLGPR